MPQSSLSSVVRRTLILAEKRRKAECSRVGVLDIPSKRHHGSPSVDGLDHKLRLNTPCRIIHTSSDGW